MEEQLYKLSFIDKTEWLSEREVIYTEPEEGFPVSSTYTIEGDTIREVGHVPIDATYDDEGNELTPPSQHDDFSVDILTKKTYANLNDYIISDKKWWHNISGVVIPLVEKVEVIETPTLDWLKADIQAWLTDQGIEWSSSMTKAELLNLI